MSLGYMGIHTAGIATQLGPVQHIGLSAVVRARLSLVYCEAECESGQAGWGGGFTQREGGGCLADEWAGLGCVFSVTGEAAIFLPAGAAREHLL